MRSFLDISFIVELVWLMNLSLSIARPHLITGIKYNA